MAKKTDNTAGDIDNDLIEMTDINGQSIMVHPTQIELWIKYGWTVVE